MRKYSGTYYNTEEAAQSALERWRKSAYRRIERKGDKVLKDDSCVYQRFVWTKPKKMENCNLFSSGETNIKKWFIFKGIWTQSLVDDIANMPSLDAEAELTALMSDPALQKANEIYIKSLNKKP